MPGINLSQSSSASGAAVAKKSSADKGFLISIAILIITLLIFGGLRLTAGAYSSKKAGIENQIKAVRDELSGKEVERVADFQQRINNIHSNFSAESAPNDMLAGVAGAMVSGSVATSISSASGGASAVFTVDSYQTAARQILGLKNSGFSRVKISKIDRSSEGKISISVDLAK